jgi:hypothetical protein
VLRRRLCDFAGVSGGRGRPMIRRMFVLVLLGTVFWPASGQSLDKNGKSFALGAGVNSCGQ